MRTWQGCSIFALAELQILRFSTDPGTIQDDRVLYHSSPGCRYPIWRTQSFEWHSKVLDDGAISLVAAVVKGMERLVHGCACWTVSVPTQLGPLSPMTSSVEFPRSHLSGPCSFLISSFSWPCSPVEFPRSHLSWACSFLIFSSFLGPFVSHFLIFLGRSMLDLWSI